MSDSPSSYRRVMVVANHTCPCPGLVQEASDLTHPDGELLLVAPALNSRLRHWVSDVDHAVEQARDRLHEALGAFEKFGVDARGEIGDSDPLAAIRDALRTFDADAIIISTHPAGQSNWLERGLVDRARHELTMPILHSESRYGLVPAG